MLPEIFKDGNVLKEAYYQVLSFGFFFSSFEVLYIADEGCQAGLVLWPSLPLYHSVMLILAWSNTRALRDLNKTVIVVTPGLLVLCNLL